MGLSQDQINKIDALNDERQALYLLTTAPGWKLIVEHMQKTSAYAYEHMAKTDNATVMAKQVGAWHVSESILRFPEVRIAQIDALIKLFEAGNLK